VRGRGRMFEPSLIAEVSAASGAGSVPNDPQTLMYIVGGIVSGLVVGLGTLLYRKSPNGQVAPSQPSQPSFPAPAPPNVEVFAQGPYQVLLDRLSAMQLTLERIAGGHIETREATAQALQTTRHDLKAVLQHMSQASETDSAEIRADTKEIKRLLREQNDVSGRLDEFVRAKLN
jgi:Asp-tRNA(Asn)/Glu-tRNA(Gln) amidotransferase C subunit